MLWMLANAYKWACKLYKRSYEWCECLTNVCHCLAIFLRMMRIFDAEAAIGINTEWIWRWAHCVLEFNSGKTFARNGKQQTLQTPWKCLTNVSSASEWLTNVTNGLRMLTKIDGDWQHSQHSLKFRRRFLNWPIFVSRWRMTCERSEFVTNAYKYSAIVANFERMSNLFIRSTFASIFAYVWEQHQS